MRDNADCESMKEDDSEAVAWRYPLLFALRMSIVESHHFRSIQILVFGPQ